MTSLTVHAREGSERRTDVVKFLRLDLVSVVREVVGSSSMINVSWVWWERVCRSRRKSSEIVEDVKSFRGGHPKDEEPNGRVVILNGTSIREVLCPKFEEKVD